MKIKYGISLLMLLPFSTSAMQREADPSSPPRRIVRQFSQGKSTIEPLQINFSTPSSSEVSQAIDFLDHMILSIKQLQHIVHPFSSKGKPCAYDSLPSFTCSVDMLEIEWLRGGASDSFREDAEKMIALQESVKSTLWSLQVDEHGNTDSQTRHEAFSPTFDRYARQLDVVWEKCQRFRNVLTESMKSSFPLWDPLSSQQDQPAPQVDPQRAAALLEQIWPHLPHDEHVPKNVYFYTL